MQSVHITLASSQKMGIFGLSEKKIYIKDRIWKKIEINRIYILQTDIFRDIYPWGYISDPSLIRTILLATADASITA